MNCARVEIQAPAMSRVKRSTRWKRQASMDQLPDMFVCNVDNGCTTIEGQDVNFPYPGNTVLYGRDLITPTDGTGFTGSGFAGDSAPNNTSNGTTISPPYYGNMTTNGTSIPYSVSKTLTTSSPSASSATQSSSALTASATTTGTVVSSLSAITSSAQVVLTTAMASSSSGFAIMPISASMSPSTRSCADMASAATYTSHLSLSQFTTVFPTPSTLSTMITPVPSPVSPFSYSSPSYSTDPAEATPTAMPTSCIPGTFFCNTPTSFSTCISPTYSSSGANFIYMGSVAAGMTCVNGPNGAQIERQNDGPCTPNGQIFCKGSTAFYMCTDGGLIDMGPVAPGTQCSSGQIGKRWQRIDRL